MIHTTPKSGYGAEPITSPDDLLLLDALCRADWTTPVTTATAFSTDIVVAKSGKEHRRGLMGTPYHVATSDVGFLNRADMRKAQFLLLNRTKSHTMCPLWSDATRITTANPSTVFFGKDLTNRRFFVGGLVAVWSSAGTEIREVSVISGNQMTLTSALSLSHPAGAALYPVFEARPSLQGAITTSTNGVGRWGAQAYERIGRTSLAPLQAPGTSTTANNFEGYPVWEPRPNYRDEISTSYQKNGTLVQSGLAETVTLYTDRPRTSYKFSVTALDRTRAFDVVKFFESRAGRMFPFWMPSPTADFPKHASASGTVLTFPAEGTPVQWDDIKFVAVWYTNGSVAVRRISSVVRAGSVDTVNLATSIPAGTVRMITKAIFCRFTSDELQETWVTSEVCEFSISVVEVL